MMQPNWAITSGMMNFSEALEELHRELAQNLIFVSNGQLFYIQSVNPEPKPETYIAPGRFAELCAKVLLNRDTEAFKLFVWRVLVHGYQSRSEENPQDAADGRFEILRLHSFDNFIQSINTAHQTEISTSSPEFVKSHQLFDMAEDATFSSARFGKSRTPTMESVRVLAENLAVFGREIEQQFVERYRLE